MMTLFLIAGLIVGGLASRHYYIRKYKIAINIKNIEAIADEHGGVEGFVEFSDKGYHIWTKNDEDNG